MTSTAETLPDGWEALPLSAIGGRPQYGWTTKAQPHGSIKLLRTTDITAGPIDWSSVPGCASEPPDIAKYELCPGDIVVSRAGSVGVSYLLDESCPPGTVFASYLMRLRPDPEIMLPDLVYQFMQSPQYWTQISEAAVGIGMANVSGSKLGAIRVPVPPRHVQAELSSVLDSIRRHAGSAGKHVAAARRALNRFRQAVLAAACSGRLTADWREDERESVRVEELVDRLDSRHRARRPAHFTAWDFDAPKPWGRVSLDRLTSVVTSGSRGWAKYYASEGSVFIRAQNINSDQLDLSDAVLVRPPPGSEGVRTRVSKGDLLVTITGANVTRAAWVEWDIGEAYVNQHVALVRPLIPEMSQYLHLWTISLAHGRKRLAADAYGAGKPGLNLDNLRTMPVALPSLEEQAEIVRRVNALNELVDRVDEQAAAAILDARRSSKAVLAKTFRGELAKGSRGDLETKEPVTLRTSRSSGRTQPGRQALELRRSPDK